MAADSDLLSILILLDPSATFDTISQSILLNRRVSLRITTLAWFQSYLSSCTQFIQFTGFQSSDCYQIFLEKQLTIWIKTSGSLCKYNVTVKQVCS